LEAFSGAKVKSNNPWKSNTLNGLHCSTSWNWEKLIPMCIDASYDYSKNGSENIPQQNLIIKMRKDTKNDLCSVSFEFNKKYLTLANNFRMRSFQPK
jgi:hypothetical protein